MKPDPLYSLKKSDSGAHLAIFRKNKSDRMTRDAASQMVRPFCGPPQNGISQLLSTPSDSPGKL